MYLYTSDGPRVCDLHVGNNCNNIDHCRVFVIFAILELRTCKQHSVSFAQNSLGVRLSVLEIPSLMAGLLGLVYVVRLSGETFCQE